MSEKKITIETAKNGSPTAVCGTARLHSAYSPEKEAGKFLNQIDIEKNKTIIIVGCALGYLDKLINQKYPDKYIISIHPDKILIDNCVNSNKTVKRWSPQYTTGLETFLQSVLPETSVNTLKIIEWQPSLKIWPDFSEKTLSVISSVILQYTGNITTTAVFGRKWIKNLLRNYLSTKYIVIPKKINRAVFLAASGPALQYAIDDIKEHRNKFYLWALPSSAAALAEADIVPDLVISTDPGYWANEHLRYFPEKTPVAMPFSSIPLKNRNTPVLLMYQDIPGEQLLLDKNIWPGIKIQETGTVAAAAVILWSQISTEWPLIICGIDFAWQDLQSHVKPHSFDNYFYSKTSRTNPALSVFWKRAVNGAPEKIKTDKGIIRTGTALRTYRDWFKRNLNNPGIYYYKPGNFYWNHKDVFKHAEKDFLASLPSVTQEKMEFMISENTGIKKEKIKKLIRQWETGIKNISENTDPDNYLSGFAYYIDPGNFISLINAENSRKGFFADRLRSNITLFLNELGAIYG